MIEIGYNKLYPIIYKSKPMIQTSKDILFLVLGVSILAVSFFACLLFYYLVRLIKKLYNTGKFIEKVGNRINEITKTAERKVREITLLPLLSEAIRAVIEFLREKRKTKEKKEEKE